LHEDPKIDTAAAVGRPLLRISLWINYALGGLAVRGYHLFNLLLHLLTAFALYSLARRILESPRLRDCYGEAAWGLALSIALLWTTHPLQTESVTYVVQRAEILGGWFYLLTLYSVARSAEAEGRPLLAWSGAAVAFCLLGMASKETVATAPLLGLAMDRIFFATSWKRLWQARRRLYGALVCTWIFQVVLIAAASGRKGSVGFGLSIPWWQYALTQPYFLCRYLLLSLWPHALTFDYGTYLSRTAGEVVPYTAIVLLLSGLTLVALRRSPALGFCGLWFFLILAPTSSVVPVITQTGAEHRMYLPLAGLIALVVVGGYAVLRRFGRDRPGLLRVASVLLLAIAAAVLCARTVIRNEDYRSELSIWGTVIDEWPLNPRAHYNLGIELAKAGRTPAAIAQFQEALRLQPDHTGAHVSLGNALESVGRIPEAIAEYRTGLRLQPNLAGAHLDLGIALAIAGRLPEAIAEFEEAVRLKPDYPQAHLNWGNALARAGQLPEAIAQFEQVVRLQSDNAEAHLSMGDALASMGRLPEAITQYDEALALEPDLAQGRVPEAIAELEKALLLPPPPPRSTGAPTQR
jgi:Flp pilus assembly protein TadD